MQKKSIHCVRKAEECIAEAISYLCAIHGEDASGTKDILADTRAVASRLHKVINVNQDATQ